MISSEVIFSTILKLGSRRADIKPVIAVMVELTEDNCTDRLKESRVKDVLTTSPNHPRKIKIRLEN